MATEKPFTKYKERGPCHWLEEFGPLWKFNLMQHSRYLAVLQEIPSPVERICDWGCGDGALSRHLLGRGKFLLGVDIDPDGLTFFTQFHTEPSWLQGPVGSVPPSARGPVSCSLRR